MIYSTASTVRNTAVEGSRSSSSSGNIIITGVDTDPNTCELIIHTENLIADTLYKVFVSSGSIGASHYSGELTVDESGNISVTLNFEGKNVVRPNGEPLTISISGGYVGCVYQYTPEYVIGNYYNSAEHASVSIYKASDVPGDYDVIIGTIDYFVLVVSSSENGEYEEIKTLNPQTSSYTPDLAETRWFKLIAKDKFGCIGISEPVIAEPKPIDTASPVASVTPDNVIGILGQTLYFSGTASADNDRIESYSWTFGDGNDAVSGAEATHVYASAGSYAVTLTVKDTAGNTSTATSSVKIVDINDKDSEYVKLNMKVVDAKIGASAPIPGATLVFCSNDGSTEDVTLTTDLNGYVQIILKKGYYTVNAIKNGYMPTTRTLNLPTPIVK